MITLSDIHSSPSQHKNLKGNECSCVFAIKYLPPFSFRVFARVTGFHFFFFVFLNLAAYWPGKLLSNDQNVSCTYVVVEPLCLFFMNCNIKLKWKTIISNMKLFKECAGKESDSKIIIAKQIVYFQIPHM